MTHSNFIQFIDQITALTRDEATALTLVGPNAEESDRSKVWCVDAWGGWTNWIERRFYGESHMAAVDLAYRAMQAVNTTGGKVQVGFDPAQPGKDLTVRHGVTISPRRLDALSAGETFIKAKEANNSHRKIYIKAEQQVRNRTTERCYLLGESTPIILDSATAVLRIKLTDVIHEWVDTAMSDCEIIKPGESNGT